MAQLPLPPGVGRLINNPVGPPAPNQLINNQIPAVGQLINNQQGPNGPQLTDFLQVPYYYWPIYKQQANQRGASESVGIVTGWNYSAITPLAFLGDVGKGAGHALVRNLPQKHPTRTGWFADSCEQVENIGAIVQNAETTLVRVAPNGGIPTTSSNFIQFVDTVSGLDGCAVFEVTYAPRPYPVLADALIQAPTYEFSRFVLRDVYPAQQQIILPQNNANYQWANVPAGGQLELFAAEIAIPRPIQQVRYTWFWVPQATVNFILGTQLLLCQGKINSAKFDIYGTGSMLCQSPQVTEPLFTPSGNQVRNITYVFDVLNDGTTWNYYYRRSSGFFEPVIGVANGNPPFQSADMNQLFYGA
jgi:hypothetical protein